MKEYIKHSAEGVALVLLVNLLVRADLVSAIAFLGALAYVYGQKYFSEQEFRDEALSRLEKQRKELMLLTTLHDNLSLGLSERCRKLESQSDMVQRQSEETRKLLSVKNVENAFIPRAKRNPNV